MSFKDDMRDTVFLKCKGCFHAGDASPTIKCGRRRESHTMVPVVFAVEAILVVLMVMIVFLFVFLCVLVYVREQDVVPHTEQLLGLSALPYLYLRTSFGSTWKYGSHNTNTILTYR